MLLGLVPIPAQFSPFLYRRLLMALPVGPPYFPGTFQDEEFDAFMDYLMDASLIVTLL